MIPRVIPSNRTARWLVAGTALAVGASLTSWATQPRAGAAEAQTASTRGATDVPVRRGPGVRDLAVPAAAGSGMYSLTAGAPGEAWLSWLEPGPATTALKFARFARGAWGPAREIAHSANWFVNWADHPSVTAMRDGTLAAHWLENNDSKRGSYGYGIRIVRSVDGGGSWHQVFSAGTTNQRDYSGFVTMLPLRDGFLAAYLTPQPAADEGAHVMGLQVARIGRDAQVSSDVVADADTCTCCSTAMVETADGPLVAYRDHEAGEIRDISVVRFVGGRWTAPVAAARDGWRIAACPTNGPSLSANGRRVAMAWFTAANDESRVKVAFSTDAGAHFSTPVVIDGGRPIGWPAIVLLDDGSAAVSWLESTGGGTGEIRVRRVRPGVAPGPPTLVASAPGGRSAGIPQMTRLGDGLLLAWRHDRVVTALVPIPPG